MRDLQKPRSIFDLIRERNLQPTFEIRGHEIKLNVNILESTQRSFTIRGCEPTQCRFGFNVEVRWDTFRRPLWTKYFVKTISLCPHCSRTASQGDLFSWNNPNFGVVWTLSWNHSRALFDGLPWPFFARGLWYYVKLGSVASNSFKVWGFRISSPFRPFKREFGFSKHSKCKHSLSVKSGAKFKCTYFCQKI